MALTSRSRSRTKNIGTGTVTFPGSSGPVVGGPGSLVAFEQTMSDYIGKKRRDYDTIDRGLPPSPMSTTKIWRKPVLLNGSESGSADSGWWFHNYLWSAAATQPGPHVIPPGRDLGDPTYVLRLLRKTNPMAPEYSIPVAIKELVEVTSLFKLAARSFAAFVGGAYLNYRFGWTQFYQDVRLLAKLAANVVSRFEALRRMQERGGVRRRIRLDQFGSNGSSPNFLIQSAWSVSLRSDAKYSTRVTVWGSVRWVPHGGNISLLPTAPQEQYLLALRQAMDLESPDPHTLWNLIPFSWLVDYFTGISDYLAAYEGRAIVEPRDVCIMRETDTYVNFTRRKMGNNEDRIYGGAGSFRRLTQERSVPSLPSFPPVFANVLQPSELAVITALLLKVR